MKRWFEPYEAEELEKHREYSRGQPQMGYSRLVFDCFNATARPRDRVGCAKGHPLGSALDGTFWMLQVLRGARAKTCQECQEYEGV